MNGETQMQVEMIEKTKDRFDLEQEILECWKVTNDMQMYVDQGAATEDFKVLINYYERKFNLLWETFESMIHERKM
jgi:hypothetical protein